MPESNAAVPSDPLAVATVPGDEQWNDTLDALSRAIVNELDERGLLREGASEPVRYHFRGYARRLLLPVLDEARTGLQQRSVQLLTLRQENDELRQVLAEARAARRRQLRRARASGLFVALLVLLLAALLAAPPLGS